MLRYVIFGLSSHNHNSSGGGNIYIYAHIYIYIYIYIYILCIYTFLNHVPDPFMQSPSCLDKSCPFTRTAGALDSYRLTERKIRFSFGPKEYQISARRPAVGRAFQVMPIACSAFGGQIPPPQTPVKFKAPFEVQGGYCVLNQG